MSAEHKANIAKANAARKGESHKCPPGCHCARHKAYYRGGSKKGRVLSEQAKANMTEAARNRAYTDEDRQARAEALAGLRESPEWEAQRIAALRQVVEDGCPEGCECEKHSERVRQLVAAARLGTVHSDETKAKISAGSIKHWEKFTPEERSEIAFQRIKKYGVAKVSQMEYQIAPILAKMGYVHNDDRALCVGRKFPDFYDETNKRLFEFFGHYWHHPSDEQRVKLYYESLGWDCEVLWEGDLAQWLQDHQGL